ncbi:MAG TPA: FliH/SctL family protein [Rhizomicrobium sp.]|jgi:flagellar assembly protein FliH|nr:FliH/SctL family protein [Rhizomicrobium sp.]
MTNPEARKFTFDTEFREQRDVVSEAARARQKKTLTTQELETMCAKAEASGTQVASVRASQDIERTISAMVIALRAVLDQSRAEVENLRAEAALIALAAAKKIAAAALEAAPAGEVENALRQAMHQAVGEPRIILRAAPDVVAALEGRVADIAHEEGYEGRVTLAVDPAIAGGDCRIEWRGGGSERSEAAIESAIGALIARYFSNSSEVSKG